jgi:hypothetical protein
MNAPQPDEPHDCTVSVPDAEVGLSNVPRRLLSLRRFPVPRRGSAYQRVTGWDMHALNQDRRRQDQ